MSSFEINGYRIARTVLQDSREDQGRGSVSANHGFSLLESRISDVFYYNNAVITCENNLSCV